MTEIDRKSDFSFLDVAIVVAESWILLTVGPVVVALIAFFFAQMQGVQYRSTVEVSVSPAVASEIFDELRNSSLQTKSGVHTELFVKSASVVTVAATSELPSEPVRVLQNFVSEVRNKLADEAAAKRLTQIAAIDTRLDEVSASIELLQKALLRTMSQTPLDGAGYAALVGRLEQLQDSKSKIEERLAEVDSSSAVPSESVVVRGPTSAAEIGRRRPALVALSVGLCAGLALLIFVFVRQGFRSARASPEGAAKVARIKKALYLSR